MINEKRKKINLILENAKWLLVIGGLVILIMPFILTRQLFDERFNFSETGQIGDTIGGITAPFINLIGSCLVFYALKAQVEANELIQDQIDKDNEDNECKNEEQNLNQLYSYLSDSINSFRFKTLPVEYLNVDNDDTTEEFKGGEAFFHLFSQIRCHYHGTQSDLYSHQPVSELISVLKIMDLLLNKLKITKSRNKDILITLVKHLFYYKVITRIRDEENSELNLEFCDTCGCNHGLPDELRNLIIDIRQKTKAM